MLRPSDLLISVLVITVVVWLNVPKLLAPVLVLTILLLSGYRWLREGKEPMAAERYRWRLVASCVVIAAISVPLILKVVPPNGVYGFRTNLTRSSTDIWYSANAFMGWALLAAAIMSAGAVTILPGTAKRWMLLATFLAPLVCAVVASFMYLERLA
jgi:SdpI/YhfL family protein